MEYEPLTDSKKMEEKQLTPQESVQMIEKMLEQTRKRLIRGAGIPSLIWGYVTFATSLLILFVYPHIGYRANYLWMLIPIVGGSLTIICNRKRQKEAHARTQIDRFIDTTWITIGLNVTALSILAYRFPLAILPLVLILIGIATAITGFSHKVTLLKYSSIFGILVGYMLLVVPMNGKLMVLIFGLTFFLMHCVPRHYLCYLERKILRDA